MKADPSHMVWFAEFCEREIAAGGPDPHMRLTERLALGADPIESWWIAGCYFAVYNFPTAEALAREMPIGVALALGPERIEAFLKDVWPGIATRRERRSVRIPRELARCLYSWADFTERWHNDGQPWFYSHPELNYGWFWELAQSKVHALGRYSSLKLLELLGRLGAPLAMPDLRIAGGWSPRAAMALILPEQADWLNGTDRVAEAESAGEWIRDKVSKAIDHPLTRFEAQVLLCDYKQSYLGKRQYPGRSQDSEMEYAAALEPHWRETQMWRFRAEIFPHWALGELNGWHGVRKPLGSCLAEFGYTWSDERYDWLASADDLSTPVARSLPASEAAA